MCTRSLNDLVFLTNNCHMTLLLCQMYKLETCKMRRLYVGLWYINLRWFITFQFYILLPFAQILAVITCEKVAQLTVCTTGFNLLSDYLLFTILFATKSLLLLAMSTAQKKCMFTLRPWIMNKNFKGFRTKVNLFTAGGNTCKWVKFCLEIKTDLDGKV